MEKAFEYYLIGLLQTDGHLRKLSRNRGSLSIELKYEDKEILEKIGENIDFNYKITERTRNTNFKNNYRSIILTIYDKGFRDWAQNCGIPYGKKDDIVKPFVCTEDEYVFDYIRGLIDGDGSLGVTSKKRPFINLTTNSEWIKDFWIDFIQQYSSRRIQKANKTKRDNSYQITVFDEDAQTLVSRIYYDGCIGIKRKKDKSNEVKSWVRSSEVKKINFKRHAWNDKDDKIIKNNDLKTCLDLMPYRTASSIKTRKWKLKHK